MAPALDSQGLPEPRTGSVSPGFGKEDAGLDMYTPGPWAQWGGSKSLEAGQEN